MRILSHLWPRNLVGQLLLAVALTLFVAQAANFWLLARGREEARLLQASGPAAQRVIDSIDRIENGLPVSGPLPDQRWRERSDGTRTPRRDPGSDVRGRAPRVALLDTQPVPRSDAQPWPELAARVLVMLDDAQAPVVRVLAWRDTGRSSNRHLAEGGKGLMRRDRITVAVQLADGRWLQLRGRVAAGEGRFSALLLGQTLLIYLLLLGPLLWIGWRVARPLRALTLAAQGPVTGGNSAPIAPSGPADVQALTAAFNDLRARVTAMLGDKDRMLGAIGHDLRTPLASLRVRVEQVGDAPLQGKMIASIDEMAAMLTDILSLARVGQGVEAAEDTDLRVLLADLAADYAELGRDVSVAGGQSDGGSAVAAIRVGPMRRALRNLVDNALSYGTCARLSLDSDGAALRITVSDDGPGIPPDQIAAMLEPFARAETSRNRATGGAGLGLALARMVVHMDGGTLSLINRAETGDQPAGLDAVISLPRTARA